MSEQGRKYDGGKLRYDLVPTLALEEVVKVITKGAEKYDDDNWKNVPEGRRRYYAASMRHTQEWKKGNPYDEEMGTHHIANAISNLMFILEKELQGWDDSSDEHLQEVEEDNIHPNEDISEDVLKNYVDTLNVKVVDGKFEVSPKLWYPPVEEGGNPWIEWCPTPWSICPKEVSESTVVDVLMDYEREEEEFETSPQKAMDWYWRDSSIVAYRVVKE